MNQKRETYSSSYIQISFLFLWILLNPHSNIQLKCPEVLVKTRALFAQFIKHTRPNTFNTNKFHWKRNEIENLSQPSSLIHPQSPPPHRQNPFPVKACTTDRNVLWPPAASSSLSDTHPSVVGLCSWKVFCRLRNRCCCCWMCSPPPRLAPVVPVPAVMLFLWLLVLVDKVTAATGRSRAVSATRNGYKAPNISICLQTEMEQNYG